MKYSIRVHALLLFCLVLSLAFSAPLSKENTGQLTPAEVSKIQTGEVVTKEVFLPDRDGLTFEVVGEIQGSLPELLSVLMNYRDYPEFMSTVKRVEVVEQHPDSSILNFYLSLPMGMSRKYRISIALTQPDAQTWLLEWDMIDWPGLDPADTIRDTEGYWLIKEMGLETQLVIYRVFSDPGKIPYGLKWLVSPISQTSVTQAFLDARNRVEKNRRTQKP